MTPAESTINIKEFSESQRRFVLQLIKRQEEELPCHRIYFKNLQDVSIQEKNLFFIKLILKKNEPYFKESTHTGC
jgi:hypothetical protein